MKILQNKITVTQTKFPSNFGAKLSFIMPFLAPEHQSAFTVPTYIFTKTITWYVGLQVQNMPGYHLRKYG